MTAAMAPPACRALRVRFVELERQLDAAQGDAKQAIQAKIDGHVTHGEPIIADTNRDVLSGYQQMLREARSGDLPIS